MAEAISLSLVAALFWGAADFGAGLKARELSVFVVGTGMLLVGALAAAVALFVAGAPDAEAGTVALALAAGLTTAVGLGAFYRALAIGPMSVVAPISAAGVVIPVVAGLATGDSPSAGQMIGIALAIGGMLTVVARSDDPIAASGDRPVRAHAVMLAIVGALGLGAYYLTAREVPTGQAGWFSMIGQLTAGATLALGVLVRRPSGPRGQDWVHIAALGCLGFAAWASSAAAVRAGDVSLTATISSLYPLVTVLLAVSLIGESLQRVQAVGLVVAFLGVGLIAGG